MDLSHAPLVFLHIPKTAGQTVHNSLSRIVKERRVSPIRVHTQTNNARDQYPTGYSLYSGHLDWTSLDHLPQARHVFTVLRDPGERIASFYFFLQREAMALDARTLNAAHNIGLKRALEWAPDDYFFGGDDAWQTFVRSHYDNFYCTFFATRRMLGWGATQGLTKPQLVQQATTGLAAVDQVYSTQDMGRLESDLRQRLGVALHLKDQFDNTSGEPSQSLRWPRLLASFATDIAARQMHGFVESDLALTKGLL